MAGSMRCSSVASFHRNWSSSLQSAERLFSLYWLADSTLSIRRLSLVITELIAEQTETAAAIAATAVCNAIHPV
ncbi:hypothetical protein Rcae01_05569 [Novipirellula caenicola]|uniref:Uncharacterized protein n=1 Tax=Novipirellula caenicola TaxID=1536901 RepID=A0ABP9W0P9_9BACT